MTNRIDFSGGGAPARIESDILRIIEVFAGDLPCPWCGEATAEADVSCQGCGRRFG